MYTITMCKGRDVDTNNIIQALRHFNTDNGLSLWCGEDCLITKIDYVNYKPHAVWRMIERKLKRGRFV